MKKAYAMISDMPLAYYNSMRIEAWADTVYLPYSAAGVEQIFTENPDEQFIILGKGSNTIFSQKKYSKPIILSTLLNNMQEADGCLYVDSGVTLSELSWYALEKSVPGYEFLEDIPGSVGGALTMNAGTYDDCIGDKVVSVTVYDYFEKRIKTLSKEQLASYWGKRKSYFQGKPSFIIQCVLKAEEKGEYIDILSNLLEIKRRRYIKQPRNYPSAGSAFKRPYVDGEAIYIWTLFDKAGLRGYRIGDAQVSEKHPGFIVNTGKATGQDVIDLINYCKQIVWEKYKIKIEEEFKIV